MSGNRSRRKGYRTESKVRAIWQAAGIDCRRVPLSGSAPGWAGDLTVAGRSFEVKARAQGFLRLYRWLEGHFGLVVAADRRDPLVVLRLGDFLRACRLREPGEIGRAKPFAEVSGTAAGGQHEQEDG